MTLTAGSAIPEVFSKPTEVLTVSKFQEMVQVAVEARLAAAADAAAEKIVAQMLADAVGPVAPAAAARRIDYPSNTLITGVTSLGEYARKSKQTLRLFELCRLFLSTGPTARADLQAALAKETGQHEAVISGYISRMLHRGALVVKQ